MNLTDEQVTAISHAYTSIVSDVRAAGLSQDLSAAWPTEQIEETIKTFGADPVLFYLATLVFGAAEGYTGNPKMTVARAQVIGDNLVSCGKLLQEVEDLPFPREAIAEGITAIVAAIGEPIPGGQVIGDLDFTACGDPLSAASALVLMFVMLHDVAMLRRAEISGAN